jgi:hypothetical protein
MLALKVIGLVILLAAILTAQFFIVMKMIGGRNDR